MSADTLQIRRPFLATGMKIQNITSQHEIFGSAKESSPLLENLNDKSCEKSTILQPIKIKKQTNQQSILPK